MSPKTRPRPQLAPQRPPSLNWSTRRRLFSIRSPLDTHGGAINTPSTIFIAWYCSEPRLTFNRSVFVSYRSSLERPSLSAATINLQLSAIRRLADESAESGRLSPELAIGIRRVKGVGRLGRKMGNWLARNQAQEQELVDAASKNSLRGWRDGAMLGLLLGCKLRRSEVVGLNLDQLQSREVRWVIVNLVGKGGRLRTVPIHGTIAGILKRNAIEPAAERIRKTTWKEFLAP